MKNKCPAPNCETMIDRKFAFCRPHWYSLPNDEKVLISRSVFENGAGTQAHGAIILQVAANISS